MQKDNVRVDRRQTNVPVDGCLQQEQNSRAGLSLFGVVHDEDRQQEATDGEEGLRDLYPAGEDHGSDFVVELKRECDFYYLIDFFLQLLKGSIGPSC